MEHATLAKIHRDTPTLVRLIRTANCYKGRTGVLRMVPATVLGELYAGFYIGSRTSKNIS